MPQYSGIPFYGLYEETTVKIGEFIRARPQKEEAIKEAINHAIMEALKQQDYELSIAKFLER